MNDLQKYLSTCLLATAALLVGASPAWAQVALGAAAGFSVLGGTNVTCTDGVVSGDVGVSPGATVPFTNTRCTIAGGMPPATNTAAAPARTAFLSAYGTLQSTACTDTTTLSTTITGPVTLAPGVYCTGAALTGTGVLTLDAGGNANAVWIFKIGTGGTGALTGTSFSVVMAGGGQPCNVYWVPSGGVTMTTSALKGNILAGATATAADPGSITLTDTILTGRALANVAVTMTGSSVIGCGAASGPPYCVVPPKPSCDTNHQHHKRCKLHDYDPPHCDGNDDDDGHGWDSHWPFQSKDDHGGKDDKGGKR